MHFTIQTSLNKQKYEIDAPCVDEKKIDYKNISSSDLYVQLKCKQTSVKIFFILTFLNCFINSYF